MSEEPSQPSRPSHERRSILEQVAERTGLPTRVSLRDSDEEGQAIVDPRSPEAVRFPASRHHYQVLGEIARGGMGVVLKAQDTELGREVAIKVLDARFGDQPAILQRFVEEAQIGGQLQHPGVVPVYEMGLLDDERPFIAMKYVKGRTLSALLAARKDLGEERRRFLSIFESVCQTVAYAHSKGVLHRDLKPANVMVGAFGEVQVGDWGLAKVLAHGGNADEERARASELSVIETVRSGPGSPGSSSSASQVGTVMGTPAYMPPEQALGQVELVDERSDVFALGGLLCEILTGKPPYVSTADERTVVMAANARQDVARERLAACDADEALKALALECLSPSRAARPRDAGEVAGRIQKHLSAVEERLHAAQLAAAEAAVKVAAARRARRLTIALASSAVVALLAIGLALRVRAQGRAARVAEVRARLDDDATRVVDLQRAGSLTEALDLASTSLAFLEASPIEDAELHDRALHLVDAAHRLVDAEVERRARDTRNAQLRTTLDSIRVEAFEAVVNGQAPEIDRRFTRAFDERGLTVDLDAIETTLAELRSTGIPVELAAALDDWAWVRHNQSGRDPYESTALTALALDLDPDRARTQVREAILERDAPRLRVLGEEALATGEHTDLLFPIGRALYDLDQPGMRVFAQRMGSLNYLDQFSINAARALQFRRDSDHRKAVGHLRVAGALRPENPAVRFHLGTSLKILGDLLPAREAFLAAEARGYDAGTVAHALGVLAWDLGDLDTAARELERALRAAPDDRERSLDLLAARYVKGEVSHEAFLDRLANVGSMFGGEFGSFAVGLLDHPDATPDDAARALEVVRVAERARGLDGYLLGARAEALVDLGRTEEARAAVAAWEAQPASRGPLHDAARAYLRARILRQAGGPDAARAELAAGDRLRGEFVHGYDELWERSRVMRLRREAIDALAR